LAAALVVVVAVVVVVVGAVVPCELHATDSVPAATAITPIVNGARRQIRAMVNDNGISLPREVFDVTARYIPTGRRRQVTEPWVGLYVELPVSPLS